jgi:hypothetical protein
MSNKKDITVHAKCKIMVEGNLVNATVIDVWPTTYSVEVDGIGSIYSNIPKDIWYPASSGEKEEQEVKEAKDVFYKWSKIFAAKRYGGKNLIALDALDQDELLQDIKSINK